MLQPDAFCQHTMQQNATAAGALHRTPLGSLQRSPDVLAGFGGKGKRKGRQREERGREGGEGEGREVVDSDAQLELQGRRLAKLALAVTWTWGCSSSGGLFIAGVLSAS